jgi:molybdopterin converting factor small subunit
MAIQRAPGWATATVTVRFFAGAMSAAGTAEEQVTLSTPLTLRLLSDELVARHGDGLARVLAAASWIVDEEATTDLATPLADGARVDLLPPFAGG